jgi:hypothetical protein
MRISSQEFFASFCSLFAESFASDPTAIERFQPAPLRTKFMKDFMHRLAARLGSGRVDCKSEFRSVDFCFWDTSDEWNKMQYNQPLYVLALVEHENTEHIEEEFWKLLHWYAPLKVVVCYETWPRRRQHFNELKAKVHKFLARSPEEEYLVIVGSFSDGSVNWSGWRTTSMDADFTELLLSPH